MPENEKKSTGTNDENKNTAPATDDDKAHIKGEKKISVLENLRQMNERERKAQLEEESRKAEMLAEKERAERNEYAKKLANDKIELMKLKQGVISEEDIPKEVKEERIYTVGEKISNFFYHNKLYIVFTAFVAALAVFLIYDIIATKDPDVAIMIIAEDNEFTHRTQDIEKLFEPYCEDFNEDGEIYVRVSYLPAVYDESKNSADPYYNQANQTKLMAEFQSDASIIVIADEYTCKEVDITDGVLADMREIYPEDENASELGYMLSGTNFAEDIKYTAMADDLFLGFRVPTDGLSANEERFRKNYESALKLWDNYLNGITVETDAKYHSEKK